MVKKATATSETESNGHRKSLLTKMGKVTLKYMAKLHSRSLRVP